MEKTSWWPQSYSTSLKSSLAKGGGRKGVPMGAPTEFVMSRSTESFVSTLWLVKPLELHFPSRDDDGAGEEMAMTMVSGWLTRRG